jgi:hypothetical protein
MAVNWTTGQTPRRFLLRKLVEGRNNVLSLSADFFNLTSKFGKIGKIGLLHDPGGQGSNPKDMWIGFEQCTQKKIVRVRLLVSR